MEIFVKQRDKEDRSRFQNIVEFDHNLHRLVDVSETIRLIVQNST